MRERKKYHHRKKISPRTKKQCNKVNRDIVEIQSQEDGIKKRNRKILNTKQNMKKKLVDNSQQKKKYEKHKYTWKRGQLQKLRVVFVISH